LLYAHHEQSIKPLREADLIPAKENLRRVERGIRKIKNQLAIDIQQLYI
jgi:hypothetical protein